MKARKIQNISQSVIPLRLEGGGSASLPVNGTIENISITNETELRGKIIMSRDLTEVNESHGKKQLRD